MANGCCGKQRINRIGMSCDSSSPAAHTLFPCSCRPFCGLWLCRPRGGSSQRPKTPFPEISGSASSSIATSAISISCGPRSTSSITCAIGKTHKSTLLRPARFQLQLRLDLQQHREPEVRRLKWWVYHHQLSCLGVQVAALRVAPIDTWPKAASARRKIAEYAGRD